VAQVSRQTPAAGTAALPGDLLRIHVPVPTQVPERRVDLPVATGMLLDGAMRMLAARGIPVRVETVLVPGHPYAGTGRVAASWPVSLVPRSMAAEVVLWVVK